MKVVCGFLVLVLLLLTSSAQLQNPPSFPPDTKAPPPQQQQRHEHGTTLKAHQTAATAGKPPETCPITQPPVKPFVPPSPYSASIDPHYFWYGTEKLWTSLPVDGTWKGLPHYRSKNTSFRQKMLWFRQGYSWHRRDPEQPLLKVTGRRLDAQAPRLDAGSSNGYTKSLNLVHDRGNGLPNCGLLVSYGTLCRGRVDVRGVGCEVVVCGTQSKHPQVRQDVTRNWGSFFTTNNSKKTSVAPDEICSQDPVEVACTSPLYGPAAFGSGTRLLPSYPVSSRAPRRENPPAPGGTAGYGRLRK